MIESLVLVFIALLYGAALFIARRHVFSRLSPFGRRLSLALLAAQLTVLLLALSQGSSTEYSSQIWHLDLEANIPTALAGAQLALVAALCLLTARRPLAARNRRYWNAVGLLFALLALDEAFAWHELIAGWALFYAAVGICLALASGWIAAKAPRPERVWPLGLLAGLAVSAAGALLLEQLRFEPSCGGLGFWRGGRCHLYYIEETLEFCGVWLSLLAALGMFSTTVASPSRRLRRLLYALPALALMAQLALSPYAPGAVASLPSGLERLQVELARRELRAEFESLRPAAEIRFEPDLRLAAHAWELDERGLKVRLFVAAPHESFEDLGYSIHLVDQVDGGSVASQDQGVDRRERIWFADAAGQPLYRQSMELALAGAPRNRALWIALSLWREYDGEYRRLDILASDLSLLTAGQAILGELVLPEPAAVSEFKTLAEFDGGFALGMVALPASARRGETLALEFSWRSDGAGLADLAQFTHFVSQESGEVWGFDQDPLGLRLPTRLWRAGLEDSESWRVPLPGDLAPGTHAVYTGLYRRGDLVRLPARDAAGQRYPDDSVPLGEIRIER